MTVVPIALRADRISALVVGGGKVATRKALSLASAGVAVSVVAPEVTPELEAASIGGRLSIVRANYTTEHIERATLVIAATDSRAVNSRIAADARAAGKLVNVSDAPAEGSFDTMAVHRSGDVTIGVSAGGVPGAAARIRDAIAVRFDRRYERAVSALRRLRSTMLAKGDGEWKAIAPDLVGSDFCESVENGSFGDRMDSWR